MSSGNKNGQGGKNQARIYNMNLTGYFLRRVNHFGGIITSLVLIKGLLFKKLVFDKFMSWEHLNIQYRIDFFLYSPSLLVQWNCFGKIKAKFNKNTCNDNRWHLFDLFCMKWHNPEMFILNFLRHSFKRSWLHGVDRKYTVYQALKNLLICWRNAWASSVSL